MTSTKMMKKVALVLAVAIMALAFVACGGDAGEASEASVVGQWTISTMAAPDSDPMTIEEYAEANGVSASDLEVIYDFKDDNTATTTMESLGVSVDGTYEFDGSKFTMTFAEVATEGTYDAESDTIEIADASTGYTTVLKRA